MVKIQMPTKEEMLNMPLKDFVSMKQLAKLYKSSVCSVRSWELTGRKPIVSICFGKTLLYPKSYNLSIKNVDNIDKIEHE